jgi:Tfp pilus assembly protein PilX
MRRVNSSPIRFRRRNVRQDERGVALITTLLLLMLLTGLTLAMAWSTRSDMLINGYYRNFRGSFYAADSGANIMRQAMIPLFQPGGAVYPKSFAVGTNPLPSPQTEAAVMAAVNGAFGTATVSGPGTGTASNSWPGQYKANLVFALKGCSTDVSLTCVPFPANAKSVNYVYSYNITSVGKSKGTEGTTLTDAGIVTVNATIPVPGVLNFAGYGMFIDQEGVCDGSTLVPGTITGPVFTNGSWNFGTGQYTFTDNVGQAGATVGTSNGCPGGVKTLPANVTAQQGFGLSQAQVTLPKNSFNQERAVLDGKGANADPTIPVTQPSPSEMNKVLKNINGTSYPSAAAPASGVYLPYSIGPGGKPVFNGGGILVEGNASITLTPTGKTGQTYSIVNGGVTTNITIDPAANSGAGSTTVSATGSPTLTITGVPQQFDPSSGADLGYDTMLYVDGSITGLKGPGQGQAAIQDGTALTVTASSNVTINGDLLYKSEPVYGPPSQPATAGHPIDSLTGNDTGQALGIFTASGDIILNDTQLNASGKYDGVMEIDASLATLSQGGTGGLINNGAQIQTLTIVGGRIQNNIKNINTVQRNVLFDKRFAANFAPPWFPSTGIQKGNNNANLNAPVITRLQWLNQNNYF